MTETPTGWIGPAPTPIQVFAILFAGICALMMAGLQPFLLGGLAGAGRLSDTQIGHAATAELLALGVSGGLAGAFLPARRLPAICAAAALVLAALDTATALSSGFALVALRAAAGLPSGVLMWIAIAFIARSPTPERWAGIYLTGQTLVQCIWVAGLTAAGAGPDFGFLTLAALCLVTAGVGLLLPQGFGPLTVAGSEATGLPPPRGWLALGACFLLLASILAVWVYAEPLSRQAGHGPEIVGMAVSVNLACQVIGGLAATLLAGRVGWFSALVGCCLGFFAVLGALAQLPGPAMFLVLQGIFGFLWLFALPFVVPMTIEADPARRAAVLIGAAQLVGGSVGPLAASELIGGSEVRGVLVFGALGFAAVCAILLVLRVTRGRYPEAQGIEIGAAR